MSMLPMVERKDAWGNITLRSEVRADLICEYVACVPCKGGGQRWRSIAGCFWAVGWEMYQDSGCPYCCGRGIWRIPATDLRAA